MPKTWRIEQRGSDGFSWVCEDKDTGKELARSSRSFRSRQDARSNVEWVRTKEEDDDVKDDDS